MTIHGIGPIDPVSKLKTTNRTSKTSSVEGKDSVSLSSEAKSMSEVYQAKETVKNAPDIRMDRVAEVKEKMKEGKGGKMRRSGRI